MNLSTVVATHPRFESFEDWSRFSLEQAMQGLEEDDLPEYTEQDLYAPDCD